MALLFSLSVNVVVLWTIIILLMDVTIDLWAWRYFIIAGTFAPVLGRFFNYTGIDRLGINVSTPITYANPLVSVILATLFLKEQLALLGYLGSVCVIVGGIILGSNKSESVNLTFEKKHLVFPILAALFYGCSHVFRELGISFVSSPLIAAAVTTTASWSWLMLYLAATHHRHSFDVTQWEVVYFASAGLMTSIAIPTLYYALQVGTVIVVTPLMNTSPLWIILISFMFFRDGEPFTTQVIGGTSLIVLGVMLLSTFGTTG